MPHRVQEAGSHGKGLATALPRHVRTAYSDQSTGQQAGRWVPPPLASQLVVADGDIPRVLGGTRPKRRPLQRDRAPLRAIRAGCARGGHQPAGREQGGVGGALRQAWMALLPWVGPHLQRDGYASASFSRWEGC